jgi:predicted nucleotidyltransferase
MSPNGPPRMSESRTLDEIIAALPPTQQAAVERRANALIAEELRHAPGHALLAAHRSPIEALCKRYGVRRLAAFGSVLQEGFDAATSDIDLTVDFGPVEGLSPAHQYFDFKAELERLFGRSVDLVELESMQDSRLKRIIERTQIPVYSCIT